MLKEKNAKYLHMVRFMHGSLSHIIATNYTLHEVLKAAEHVSPQAVSSTLLGLGRIPGSKRPDLVPESIETSNQVTTK